MHIEDHNNQAIGWHKLNGLVHTAQTHSTQPNDGSQGWPDDPIDVAALDLAKRFLPISSRSRISSSSLPVDVSCSSLIAAKRKFLSGAAPALSRAARLLACVSSARNYCSASGRLHAEIP